MRKLLASIAIPMVMVSSFGALAQDCNEVLKYGIWETHDKGSLDTTDQSFLNAMCARSREDKSGSIDAYGYGNAKKNQSSSSEVCTHSEGTLKLKREYSEKIKTAAEKVLEQWNECW